MSAATRFAALFPSYSRAHGVFRVLGKDERGKIKGKATTVAGPPAFEDHIGGTEGQGGIPLLDDDTLLWAAIDVDKYSLKIEDMAAKVTARRLPLLCCASKSGGIHLYLFLRERTPADPVRRFLGKVAAQLGVGGSEVFPKQSQRADARDIGNWINLPYFGGTERRCWHDGGWLTLEQFLDVAEASRTTVEDTPEPESLPNELQGAPPCLVHHATNGGVPEGHRHDHLYTLVVYCRKRWPDHWKDQVHALQKLMFKPALSYDDVDKHVKSVGRKDYDYECKGPWCDGAACRRAQYGSGGVAGRSCDIGSITKLVGDPTLWAIELEGRRVLVTSDQLQSQAKFNKVCMDVISRCPAQVQTNRWLAFIDSKIRDADVIESPKEASPQGMFFELLEHYLTTTNRQALSLDEVLVGKPWHDAERGVYVFRGAALFEFLDERRYRYTSQHQVWAWLRDAGARSSSVRIADRVVSAWEIDAAKARQA